MSKNANGQPMPIPVSGKTALVKRFELMEKSAVLLFGSDVWVKLEFSGTLL